MLLILVPVAIIFLSIAVQPNQPFLKDYQQKRILAFLEPEKYASDEAYQEAYQHLHYQFVASARAVQIGHQIDPENKIGCMICGITYYPLTSDPEDILFNRSKWEKGIFYCGDVQCKGKYPTYAKRLWKEHNVELGYHRNRDLVELKNGTVDLYTFSYYMSQVYYNS